MPDAFSTHQDPTDATHGSPSGGILRLDTTQGRRRIVGGVLLAGLFVVALGVVDLPSLDTVRQDVAIARSVDVVRSGVPADQVSNCFQGFCFEEDVGFFERSWSFSTTYLELILGGVVLALFAAGIADAFLFPSGGGPAFGTRGGRAMLDAESAERLRGGAILGGSGRLGALLGVGTLNAPAVVAVLVLFSPLVASVRIGLGVAAVALIRVVGESGKGRVRSTESITVPDGWIEVIHSGLGDAIRAAWRFFYRLAPWFAVGAVVAGVGTQYLTEAGVSAVVGDQLLGIAVVAVVGLLIQLPLLYEIPLVATALLLGMGTVPAGVLLFTAAAPGPVSLRRLAVVLPPRRVAVFAVWLVAVGAIGGTAALGASTFIESATVPTITFDGETCTYTGPARFGPGVVDFVVRNEAQDEGDGHTMAIVVGRLPNNVSMDHFALAVDSAPTDPLPPYFTVAGTHEFVFPGTEQTARITLHQPGTYAAVCLDGGGYYVIFEFSMPQPMGWFDEFRSTFSSYVAPETFTVAG